jgi:HEAT repeat protein
MKPAPAEGPDATSEVAPSDVMVKAVYAWVNQFGRTLKTCRLYDASNPTVVKFRDELSTALVRLLEQFGDFTLVFTANDVMFGDQSLYTARSRDDNLALPFHRDGIRSMTFRTGIAEREVDALVDAVLQVTGQNSGQDDLVTLVWEGHFSHLDIDYVPAEGDFSGGAGPESAAAAEGDSPAPWPQSSADESATAGAETVTEAETPEPAGAPGGEGRSDDWATGELTAEIEAGFAELESLAGSQVPRFLTDYNSERGVSDVTTALAIASACLTTGVTQEDRDEFAKFVPRLLRLSIAAGAWLEAREAMTLLEGIGSDEWSPQTITQELLQPISISSVREKVDNQEPAQVADFIAFVRTLGDPAVDLLNLVLAESQQRRNRHAIAEAIADMCRANPERLAPFLSDRRWFVVRNVVHILGWIGGSGIVGLLQVAMRNPDPRVRQEIAATLGQVEPRQARPLLVKMLEGADTRMFCAVLHQLSNDRHAPTARLLLGYLLDPGFENRPAEEKRAIYSALGGVGGDEIVSELEAELFRGNWFSRGVDTHRQSVARVLARIGTPQARLVLDRGATSRRVPVRQACELAIMGMNEHE